MTGGKYIRAQDYRFTYKPGLVTWDLAIQTEWGSEMELKGEDNITFIFKQE